MFGTSESGNNWISCSTSLLSGKLFEGYNKYFKFYSNWWRLHNLHLDLILFFLREYKGVQVKYKIVLVGIKKDPLGPI